MKLKELTQSWVSFTAPNRYAYPHSVECMKAYSLYHSRNECYKVRGDVRNRFSHIVSICRKHSIPMFSYGNNDTGYAYQQVGFAIPEKYMTVDIIEKLEPYIDYLDFLSVGSKEYLDVTNGEGAFIAFGIRWLKKNSYKIHARLWGINYLADARIYDKFFPKYTNK
jgi:hypothetical protein